MPPTRTEPRPGLRPPLPSPAERAGAAAAARALDDLLAALAAAGFAGWDPYDALSSPLLHALAPTPFLRTAAVQALKRSPLNLRPVLGVPRVRHTKALALLLAAAARLERLGRHHPPADVDAVAAELVGRSLACPGGRGWGYDFDVQTRWGHYRRGEPNAVATAFAAHALLDAGAAGPPRWAGLLREVCGWATASSVATADGERFYAYYPGSRTPVHNASLLLAGVVARSAEAGDDDRQAAVAAVEYSLRRQRPDGSWPYGERPGLDWVDGFHTAYVLWSLAVWHRATGDARAAASVASGLDYYLRHLFGPHGEPRATDRRTYPLDIHAAATAIWTLSELGDYDVRAAPTAAAVLAWTLRTMRRRDGRFAFQRHRRFRNSIPYLRWSDGHMVLALSAFLTREAEDG